MDGGRIAFKLCVVVGVMLCVACGGRSTRAVARRSDAAERDAVATVLASRIPPGASACTVAQPRWVRPEHRPWLRALSATDAEVWRPESVIDVYAEAQQRHRLGPGATVRLIQFRGDLDGLKRELDQSARFEVRWDEAPSECTPDHCFVSARRIAPNVVRLDRGLWRNLPAGVEAECAAMVREHPDDAEVSIRGADEMAFAGSLVPWVASVARVNAGQRVVRLVQHDTMDSVEAAEVLAASGVDVLQGRVGALGGSVRELKGNVVVSSAELTWDDLRLGMGDRQRDADNRRYMELILALEPVDGVDPRQISHARAQLRVRMSLLEHAPVHPALLAETVSLAERTLAIHNTDADLAYDLAALHLRHTGDRARAQTLFDKYSAGDPRQERWQRFGLDTPAPAAPDR